MSSTPELPELDSNKIAAEFLQANLEKALALGARQISGARNLLRVRLERTYRTYIRRLLDRHSKAKSFFARDEPIPLYDFFVPLDLATARQRVLSAGSSEIGAVAPRAILIGSGGSGKSMIMRHLLLSALIARVKTPIFAELRRIDLTEQTLEEALLHLLKSNGLDVDREYFSLALEAGHFLLLLDGFDELDRRSRVKVATAIQRLGEKYPGNWIVLSSRADPELDGWTAFTQFRVEPLDLDKAVALVQRLPFDPETKERFVRDLRAELFSRHKSFLSNPLLLSIMLLTYRDTAQIPGKLSIFYSQAYESLFQKHDALKGGYQRPRRTELDIQDFGRVFAAFCVRTYSKRLFTFSTVQALAEIERSKEITRLEFVPADFLADANQAVCLLVEEGSDLAFAHRSFQEYFAAVYVAAAPPTVKGQLIQRFSATGTDEVLRLLYEIDPFAVEKHYILPSMQHLRQKLGITRAVGVTHYRRFLKLMFKEAQFVGPELTNWTLRVGDSMTVDLVVFIRRHCVGPKPVSGAGVGRVLKDKYGAKPVPMGTLAADKEAFPVLRDSDSIIGMGLLKNMLLVESAIRQRHASFDGSLDPILN